MVKGFVYALALLSLGTTISHAQGFTFKEQDGQILPDPQVWRVSQAKLSPGAPRDLGGLPVILRGTPVVFGADYFSMLSPNRGGMMLVPTCFVRDGERILIYAMPGQGRSVVSDGTPLEIDDGRVVLQMDSNLTLILEQKGFSHPLAEQVLQNAPVRMKERRAKDAGVNRCFELVEFVKLANAEPELREIRVKLRRAGVGRHETGRNASEMIARTLTAEELAQWISSKREVLTVEDYSAFLSESYRENNKNFDKAAVVSKVMPAITQHGEGGLVDLPLFYRDVPTLLRMLRKVSASDSVKQGWLFTALRTCDAELVELILGENVRPTVNDSLMGYVAQCKNLDVPKVLARYGVELDRLMKSAILGKNKEQIDYLLSVGKRVQTAADYVRAERSFADDPSLLARMRSAIAFDEAEIERRKEKCEPASVGLGIDVCRN
ncbi:MAG: hypothetical protein ACOY3E_06295 [Pseudomonadota bacterium]